jgi:hypothetical protein
LEAEVACHSFHQLLAAADPDLLDIFARLEHVPLKRVVLLKGQLFLGSVIVAGEDLLIC